MAVPILATKLYIPSPRPKVVLRPHLIERLNESLRSPGIILISAPAGFGKTTILSEWLYQKDETHPSALRLHPSNVAWLSLDKSDNDPVRFLHYLIAALQTVAPNFGADIQSMLQTTQPQVPVESILTSLLNEITTIPDPFVLILDDYHVIDSKAVDHAVTFLVEHLPPQMHLVIATREDPSLPLARLRARGQLSELRAADLRFTLSEASEFLSQVMGLKLSPEDIAALERRTEGWVAGLQLAALSMQGQTDTTGFIQSFTGSHHFVMDYLLEEVLHQQPEHVQTFLLRTSILERLCAPLCDAVLGKSEGGGLNNEESASGFSSTPSSFILEFLERANLFLVSLDRERRWYRYHHLFADLLRQRLRPSISSSTEEAEQGVNELHIRASQWFEDNGFVLEAFQHAAAAKDIGRAERLLDGGGIPLHLSGGVAPILEWLESLSIDILNARPSLWWRHAAMLLINGQTIGVGEKLQAAEAGLANMLQGAEPDDQTRNLIGLIAMASATLALTRYDVKAMVTQSHRALEYLDSKHLFQRANAYWTLGYAYVLLGDRALARQAFTESVSLGQAAGAMFPLILATIGLGYVQELDNELHQAAETYRRVLQWAGEHPQQIIGEAHLGLARIFYEWNDLDAAEQHTQESLHLARQYESIIDRFVISEVFLARLKLAQGNLGEAAEILARTAESVRQNNFIHRMPELAAAQVLLLIRQGDLDTADQLAQTYTLFLSQARVQLARGNASTALEILESYRHEVQAKGWKDEQLKAMVLQAVAHHIHGEDEKAMPLLHEALELAGPEGFIRLFVDEGAPVAELLRRMKAEGGRMKDYIHTLLSAFEMQKATHPSHLHFAQAQVSPILPPLVEPLSPRELEVLRLIAQGLTNDEIGKQLFLALDTVKGHNRRIYDKLQVQRRTEAVARARELGLL